MIRDKLDELRTLIVATLAMRDPDAPGWVFGPLVHSLDEVEEMIDGIESSFRGEYGDLGLSS